MRVAVPILSLALFLACTVPNFDASGKVCSTGDAAEACPDGYACRAVKEGERCLKVVAFRRGASPDPSYQGFADTAISANWPTQDNGTNPYVSMDAEDPTGSGKPLRALIQWEIPARTVSGKVRAVAMELTVVNHSGGVTYSINPLLRPWSELKASWNRALEVANWETPGATGPTDSSTVLLGQIGATQVGRLTVWLADAGVAQVQAWVDDPSTNFGMLLGRTTSGANGLDFDSGESDVLADRPGLYLYVD